MKRMASDHRYLDDTEDTCYTMAHDLDGMANWCRWHVIRATERNTVPMREAKPRSS
jgi:hypothetical protein